VKIAVPKETQPLERRVALDPDACRRLVRAGLEVQVEAGAGAAACFPDQAFAEAGAALVQDPDRLVAAADCLLKVQAPGFRADGSFEAEGLRPGTLLLGSLFPTRHPEAMARLAQGRITAFSTDCIPRSTRAQGMDTLSSMANLVGYKGALLAAQELPKVFPMFMTAAGTLHQARVFVIGAGVAGLQAIATARRLGASVTATDVRPEAREQIESVGAKYIGLDLGPGAQGQGGYAAALSAEDRARQAQLLAEHCAQVDAVITTALIGGVTAPVLLDEAILRTMRPGSVVVDLGADGGGNCTLSSLGGRVETEGVTILAPLNLAATMPVHASQLFGRNLVNFLLAYWEPEAGRFDLDWEDGLLKACAITHAGQLLHGPTREALGHR
jgi:NAD(P) transhydrogenase subunit alpha